MQIIKRTALYDYLVSEDFAGVPESVPDLQKIAEEVLSDAPEEIQYFVLADSENGDEPLISWAYDSDKLKSNLFHSEEGGMGYFGVDVSTHATFPERRIYTCYLGGCSASSASSFMIATAIMAD